MKTLRNTLLISPAVLLALTGASALAAAVEKGVRAAPPDPAALAARASSSETRSARETVSQFLQCIKGGRSRDAFALTTSNSLTSWSPDFPKLKDFDRIRPLHQLGTGEHAMVVSNPFQGRGGLEVFYAVLVKCDGQWRLSRSGCVKPNEALWLMRGYQANPAVKVDALAEEVAGRWWAICDSTIVMSADGTGTELRVGPGGPTPGVEPEPFKWEVKGAELRRHFAGRQESLELIWIEDDSIAFRQPNESGWGQWHRRKRSNPPEDHPDRSR